MKPYIVVLDRDEIPGELRIPDFDHVWVEYPHTLPGECVNHLWRASIGVTHHSTVSRQDLAGCTKLQLLIVVGADPAVVDADACAQRNIRVLHLPPRDANPQEHADALMDAVEALLAGGTSPQKS